MALIDCEEIIRKSIGRGMNDSEIGEFFDQARRLFERSRAEAKANGMLPDIAKATADWTKREELAALAKKRNTQLQLKARMQVLDYCLGHFKGMEAEGLYALLCGSKYLREGARMSVDASGRALEGQYIGGLMTDLKERSEAHFEMLVKNRMSREIAEALWSVDNPGDFKGPKVIMEIAEVIHKWQEKARLDANSAGAWIGKLEGYIVRQSHDAAKIRKAGFGEWKKEIEGRLDWNRTLDGQIDPVNQPDAARDFLYAVYNDLASGVHTRVGQADPLARTGTTGSEASRMSHERVLHFKSGGDWFDYNVKFGRGGLNDAILNGLSHSAPGQSPERKKMNLKIF